MKIALSIAIPVLAIALSLPAKADTTLQYQVSQGENTAPMILKARSGEIRVEGSAIGDRFKWMVYRSADDTLYAVDPQRKVYYAVDSAAIDQLAQRLDTLRADLRERLKDMPVGQRKFIKSQIGDFLNKSDADPIAMEINMSDSTAEVNGIVCNTGRVTANGEPVGELCVASPDALGLTSAEFDAFRGMYNLITDLQTALSQEAVTIPDISALDGVPVSMDIEFNGISQKLEQVAHEPLPDYLFEIPKNYQREGPQDLPK